MTDTNQEVRETPEAHSIPCDVHSYAQEYEFRFDDGGGYTPSDAERSMIEDAIHGYLSEVASASPPAVPDAVGVREAAEHAQGILRAIAEQGALAIAAGDGVTGGDALDAYERLRAALSCIEPTPSPEPRTDQVQWIWLGRDGNDKEHVSFGRWPQHPCQSRYKLAKVQPTEHDHPSPEPQASNAGAEE